MRVLTLIAMAVAVLAVFIVGCGDRRPAPVTIRFWNGFTGPDGRTMLRIVQRFNAQNPDVRVLMQRMDWSTYYNKLFVAGIGGRAPEVFVVHTRVMARFAEAGFARPVDDLLTGAYPLDATDIDANVWAAVAFGGKHYGLPLDVHPLGMYVNRRLLREAGVVNEHGEAALPTDAPSFLDAARRATIAAAPGQPARWGFVFANPMTNAYTLMRQFGGEFFTPDYARSTMDHPRNVEALRFLVDMVRRDRVAPSPEGFDAWIGFRQGRVAMAFEGIYMLADLRRQADLDFVGAPVPQIGPHRAVWADSHNLCLREGMDERRLNAAWRFVRYLSDHSLDWAEGGQVPVRRSLRETDRFRSMPAQAAFARQIAYVRYLPSVPFIFEFETELAIAVDRALRGSRTPEEALRIATANVNRVIARRRAAGRSQ
ncbi:MAG TPA: ABC transporter substrate-binding protein [Chthonomonadales bacterium]|nr:ABC transporter substrate-binding protein [Chthonomonadales bacterium]